MNTITVMFNKIANAKAKTKTLQNICQLDGVKKAELIFGDSTDSTLNRIAVVDLYKSADAATVLQKIQGYTNVETAYIKPERRAL
ncbi:MAG TPA: hypothetical protein VIG74_04775 [Alphaproteobacteria bacterium]|jgi:hypothetical protein